MENLKEALEYLVKLGEENASLEYVDLGGETYVTRPLYKYEPTECMVTTLEVSSLGAIIDFLTGRTEELHDAMIIHIVSPYRVDLLSDLNCRKDRELMVSAKTYPCGFEFDRYYDQEDFVINMQTSFIPSPEVDLILSVAGNVENKTTANYGDNGTSQKVTISKGIAGKSDVIVPNPVILMPYRTFVEISQPESRCVFRIKDRQDGSPMFKLVEADGGLWKYEAVARIKEYFEKNIPEDLRNRITIMG